MSQYEAYPEYRDSGVKWLDVVPSHWVVSKVKYLLSFQVGWTPPTKTDSNFVGDNLWANISDLKGKHIGQTAKRISNEAAKVASMEITPKGSLLYSFKLSVGAVSLSTVDMYTNEAIASFLEEGSLLPLSFNYYALPEFILQNASTNIYGARILNQELISNALLLSPNYKEAEKIANFLDHETAKIDTLIEKQQQLIELLKEKRQAVISHAVTKGLNPDAPMKDSGVEWLGEVPAGWTLMKLRFVLKESPKNGYSPPVDGGGDVPTFSIAAVQNGQVLIDENLKYATATQDKASAARVYKGDLLLLRGNGNIHLVAKAGIVLSDPPKGCIYPDLLIRLRVNGLVSAKYLMSILSAAPVRAQIETFSKTSAGIWKISGSSLSDVEIIVPPLDIQTAITRYIQDTAGKIELLLKKSGDAILILKERRTALISAAVTGKIDVRNWQAPESTSTSSMDA